MKLPIFLLVGLVGANADVILMTGGRNVKPNSVEGVLEDSTACKVLSDLPPRPYGGPSLVGAASAVMGDHLMVCGGQDFSGPPISTFRFCYKTNMAVCTQEWTRVADFPGPVSYAGVAGSNSGSMYVSGGVKTRYSGPSPTQYIYSDKIYKYDLGADVWSELPVKLPANDSRLCSVLWQNKLIITGSKFTGFVDLLSMNWVDLPAGQAANAGCAAYTRQGTAYFLIAGGSSGKKVTEINLETFEAKALPDLLNQRPRSPSVMVTDCGKVLVAGGGSTLDIEVLSVGSWAVAEQKLEEPREDHATAIYRGPQVTCRK